MTTETIAPQWNVDWCDDCKTGLGADAHLCVVEFDDSLSVVHTTSTMAGPDVRVRLECSEDAGVLHDYDIVIHRISEDTGRVVEEVALSDVTAVAHLAQALVRMLPVITAAMPSGPAEQAPAEPSEERQ